jgi:hypothetical protein
VTGDNLLKGIDWIIDDIASRIFTMDIIFLFYFTIFVAIKPFLGVLLCIHIILQAKNTKKILILISSKNFYYFFSLLYPVKNLFPTLSQMGIKMTESHKAVHLFFFF